MDDYEDLHAFPVRDPDSMFDWEDDDSFARLRLQGEDYHVGGVRDPPYRHTSEYI